jgi:hypothetical protein
MLPKKLLTYSLFRGRVFAVAGYNPLDGVRLHHGWHWFLGAQFSRIPAGCEIVTGDPEVPQIRAAAQGLNSVRWACDASETRKPG